MLEAFFPLSIDKVANVRIQVCHLLLPVKRILTLPGDSVSLEQLYSAQVRSPSTCPGRAIVAAPRKREQVSGGSIFKAASET